MRTVRDTAIVFNVISGTDPADTATQRYEDHKVEDYTANLTRSGLSGVRMGVLKQIYDADIADIQILSVFTRAL